MKSVVANHIFHGIKRQMINSSTYLHMTTMESEVRNRKTNSIKLGKSDQKPSVAVQKKNILNEDERVQRVNSDEPNANNHTYQNIGETNKNEDTGIDKNDNRIKGQLNKSFNNNDCGDINKFKIVIEFDLMTIALFMLAFCTRIYKLAEPNNVVFDELHYGKYVSLYMKRTFFFDQHPPFGKQLVAGIAYLAGYSGNYTFARIGSEYTDTVPIVWLRFIPALCGSILAPCVYKLLLQVKLNRWTATLGGMLIVLDNALLTQSRFILMESMLLTFSTLGLLFLLKFQESKSFRPAWLCYAMLSAMFFTFAISVKFVGFYSCCLGGVTMCRYLWQMLPDKTVTNFQIGCQVIARWIFFIFIPIGIYLTVFYVHLALLYKAGPHDSIMTSAFQASLEGGLASITKGQPLNVVHGSQITLRHTLGRTCWMHSHPHVYPVRYADKRGSSHQQQVTCYSFKDVNNWWIVKRPNKTDLVVSDEPDPVRHGDEIQLVHGITSRALNSHDVAAAVTPQCQEVSCYIDYNVSMPGQILWRVDIINRDQEGPIWHAIKSQIRLIHSTTGQALRFSGRQLPEWGFNQHEIVADRVIEQPDTIWNVEEHRYTKTEDQKERERQLINAEMIPTGPTVLSFWEKFVELQTKMMWHTDQVQSHMYCSDPLEWPMMSKGIAYWVDKSSNAQIHLIGNIAIWYSGTAALFVYFGLYTFYLVRRRRLCYDLDEKNWRKFQMAGELFFVGYLLHFLPYFFVERTLFLHNYLPAFLFKILLLCFVVEHITVVLRLVLRSTVLLTMYKLAVAGWLIVIVWVFRRFLVLSYGTTHLTSDDVIALRWKDTWDFILHKDLP